MKKSYADLYLIPLPKKNLDEYKKVATKFGKMAIEYGALSYREFQGDDLFSEERGLSFSEVVKPGKNELVISAVVDFKSRAHRDQVMGKIFKDPRMEKMMKDKPLFDFKKMYYGGFSAIVSL